MQESNLFEGGVKQMAIGVPPPPVYETPVVKPLESCQSVC